MANITSLNVLRYGKHTSTTQVDSDSGVSYGFAEFEGDISLKGMKPRKLERNLRRGDNEKYTRVVGPDEVPGIGFACELRGLNSNSGGAVTTAKQTELAPLFDAIFGANGSGGTGTTAVLSGSTSTTLVTADASSLSAGGCVLFNDGTELIAREIVSKSSNTLTLDRAYSGTPTDSATVYSAVSWYPDVDAPNHTHVAFDVEMFGFNRYKLLGCMGGFTIDFPANGGLAICNFDFEGTDHTNPATASPSFTAPTCGSAIPCIDGTFWIGATEYLLRDAKLVVDVKKTPKATYSGVNGWAGFAVLDIDVRLEGTLQMGSLTSEASAANLATLQSATAQDIALQIGRTAGQSVYLRMPAADFDAEEVSVDGQEMIKFVAMGTRSGNQSNVPGALRLHLF
jgi:hypothetical protein